MYSGSNSGGGLFSNLFRRRTKRLFDDFEKKFNKMVNAEMLINIIMILVGLLFLTITSIADRFIMFIMGLYVILWAIYSFYVFIKKEYKFFSAYIGYGIISLILGIITMFSTSPLIPFGLWIIITGIARADATVRFAIKKIDSWKILVMCCLMYLVFAIVVFKNPLQHLLFGQFVGDIFILYGILNAMTLTIIRNTAVDYINEF